MTRSDLVAQLAERFSQLTHRDTEFAVKTILDAMSSALSRGHRIEIRGFGSFSINRRPPRVGRNPRSGEQVVIPEKLVPHFKPGKALREAVDARGGPARQQHLAALLHAGFGLLQHVPRLNNVFENLGDDYGVISSMPELICNRLRAICHQRSQI